MKRPFFYAVTHWFWRRGYDLGWTRSPLDDTLRSRIIHAFGDWKKWYDWGHPVMWLVGRNDSDSSGIPRGRDLWWLPVDHAEGIEASLVADLPQRHGCYLTTEYRRVREAPHVGWRIFDLQDGGSTVIIGRWPMYEEDKGRIQQIPGGLNRQQVRLFIRWYLWDHKVKAQWFGLRRWIYFKALTAAVHDKKPFSCQLVPERGSGGYSHWHCQERKWHKGDHRYNNYIWPGPGSRVEYAPTEVSR